MEKLFTFGSYKRKNQKLESKESSYYSLLVLTINMIPLLLKSVYKLRKILQTMF